MRLLIILHFLTISFSCWSQHYLPVDEGSSIRFSIHNFGSPVQGTLKGLRGTVLFDPLHMQESQFDVSVDASTVDTGVHLRDRHLMKEDYFDASKFPRLRFTSSGVEETDQPGKFVATGKLTIKKTTRVIRIPFTAETRGKDCILRGEFRLNRRDYGVGGNSISLADELTVFLSVYCRSN